jgi:hypothetical protein
MSASSATTASTVNVNMKDQLKAYKEAKKQKKLPTASPATMASRPSSSSSSRKENCSRRSNSSANKSVNKSANSPLVQKPKAKKSIVRTATIRVPEFKLSSHVSGSQPLMRTYTKDELKTKILEAVALMTQHIRQQTVDCGAANLQPKAERDYLSEARQLMRSLPLNIVDFAHIQTDSLYWLSWLKMESEAGNFAFCKQLHKQAQQQLLSQSSKQTLQSAYEMFVCNNGCEVPTGMVSKLTKKIETKQTPSKQVIKFVRTMNYDDLFQVRAFLIS